MAIKDENQLKNRDLDQYLMRIHSRHKIPFGGLSEKLLSPLVAFLLAACTVQGIPQSPEYSSNDASRVFSSGYDYIVDRYIDPVRVSDLAIHGLGNLTEIDQELTVNYEGENISLSRKGEFIGSYYAPLDGDQKLWTDLTLQVIESGREKSPELRQAKAEDIYDSVISGMLKDLDSYSRYAGADDARSNRASREGFGGIGIQILIEDDDVRIVSVLPNTPAERSGLLADDQITHIEGEPVTGLNIHQVVDRLRGKIGSHLEITVAREDNPEPLEISLSRALIVGVTVSSKILDDIAYIRITSFNKRTASGVEERIEKLLPRIDDGEITGLILDLRSNPGGLLDQAVDIANLFLENGLIVSTNGRHPDSNQSFEADDEDIINGLPIVVLINGNSASASEIVAAALQDQGRAVIVGTNSYGKGTVQNVITLPNSSELTLTWSRFHAPSGYTLQGLGVMPTVCTNEDKIDVDASNEISVEQIKTTITLTQAVTENWRSKRVPDKAVIERLRSVCPAQRKTNERDIDVAKKILRENGLYQTAKSLSFPAVAKKN
ncbi:MAG: S41 family peptidase [Rhodospirillaceae bacterium]|nr:S41 family peptidase [Rhodospirillaceae bacterium]MBT5373681.1 S41 family peptidase [Rhodospirillaceae bacterium]MBT5659410.1 S41 family peptidase [Rhodospirillaceae bacterium]MBT5753014.1 S41 family peptidase [Rhodospirillaceae bacterium]